MNTEFQDRYRQRGSVLVNVAVGMAALLGLLGLSIAVGQLALARNQLQICADVAARAAAVAIRDGLPTFSARLAAISVALRTMTGTQADVVIGWDDIDFGDWDMKNQIFTEGGDTFFPAVRVRAARTGDSTSIMGPIQLLFSGIGGGSETTRPPPEVDVEAEAIAVISCREIVFALDVSQGMVEEIAMAYQRITSFKDAMESNALPGDKIGITVYAADAMSVRDYAEAGGDFWLSSVPAELSPIPAERLSISDFVDAMNSEPNIVCDPVHEPPEDSWASTFMPTRGRGSCVRKGDHYGIDRAVEMFDEATDSCSIPGERLIILITSDIPCWDPGRLWNISERRLGGTLDEAYEAADVAAAAGVNIVPILITRGTDGNCPFDALHLPQLLQDSPAEFIDRLAAASGFVGQGLVNPSQGEVNALLQTLGKRIKVRLVQ